MDQPKVRLFDIEADGLLPYSAYPGSGLSVITKVHCIVIHDYHAGWYRRYGPDRIKEALEVLADSDMLVAHNGIKYDIPALGMLHGFYFPKDKVLDTLVLSRLIHTNLKDSDAVLLRRGQLPGRLYGSHSLEAWGYRTGIMKDEYEGDPSIEDPEERKRRKWESWNQTMEDYCEQDVRATRAIFDKFVQNEHYFGEAIETGILAVRLEHRVAWLMAQQERNGFPFGEDGAARLFAELAGKRQELMDKLVALYGSWYQPKGGNSAFLHPRTGKPLPKYPLVKYPKTGDIFNKDGKTLSKLLYVKDAPYTPVELIQFNPGSRMHIAKVLKEAGWEPVDFTETGQAVIDEDSLGDAIPHLPPEHQEAVKLILEFLTVGKRLGQLAEGDNAWMKLCNLGFIHGSVNPNGAVTGRATHAFPNIAQVPAKDKLYGPESRGLFGVAHLRAALLKRYGKTVADRWLKATQVGTDASGLELRCLAHFMARYDEGAYIDAVLNGDVHWTNVLALGFFPQGTERDKHNEEHEKRRGNAKTFIYAFLYGAGAAKIGLIVGGSKQEGKELQKRFMEATPAIMALRAAIESQLVESSRWVDGEQKVKWKRNWLKGLDGRKLHVRSPHSALNTLLQSAGALACKLWIVEMADRLEARGYMHGWEEGDFAFMAWVHDEVQVACRDPEVAQVVKEVSQEAIRYAGEALGFRCVLDSDSNEGQTWLDCH